MLSNVNAYQKILVVAAHPDDEVLGPGGTIAKYAAAGIHIDCLILGEGATSRHASREEANIKHVDDLREYAYKAAIHLGIKRLFFCGLPDNRFDSIDLLDIVKMVEKYIIQLKPSRVYTHHANDLNIDHQITFKAVLTACRPQPGCPVREIFCFETLSSTEWQSPTGAKTFVPNVFVDISKTLSNKKNAIKEYKSELRNYPHPRSLEGIELTARRWGMVVGREFAEAFELIRMVEE